MEFHLNDYNPDFDNYENPGIIDPKYCSDFLEIRDGNSEESPLIGKFCGDKSPASIQSTQNQIWIR